jgi:hypothetical protein
MTKKELDSAIDKHCDPEHPEYIEGLSKGLTKKELEEIMTKKELEDKLMEMPELEQEMIHKRMNDINTFQAHENEVYLRGTDEYGKDFQICFDAYNFLEWIDTEHLKYIKEQLIKHIKTK